MKFIDLATQYKRIKSAVDHNIQRVLEHGQFILGPEVAELEQRLAKYVEVKHCIAINNGTNALLVALMALDIEPGDEVIMPAFSFFGTASVVLQLGAVPVFVDIDEKTYNINPSLIESAITSKTKVIMPVNLYGQCADFDAIQKIANQHGLKVIEDGAQSLGARYKNRPSCSLGVIGCTSFYPAKPLGAYGEGGACFTDDDELARKIRLIANHGQEGTYNHLILGMNARFCTLQAGILLAKLDIFDQELKEREQVAHWYNEALAGYFDGPYIAPDQISVYAQYTICVSHRDALRAKLMERNIPTAVHYPKPMYQQPAVRQYLNKNYHCPVTEKISSVVLSLPFHPYLSNNCVLEVAEALKESGH